MPRPPPPACSVPPTDQDSNREHLTIGRSTNSHEPPPSDFDFSLSQVRLNTVHLYLSSRLDSLIFSVRQRPSPTMWATNGWRFLGD